MKLRRLLALGLVAAVAARLVRRSRKQRDATAEVSPIERPVPGDEPIDEADVPRDADDESFPVDEDRE